MLTLLLKFIVFIVIVGFIGLTCYSFLGDMTAHETPMTRNIVLSDS